MADTEIEIIECRDCESKNCHGCNVLTLSQMLNQGKFDSLMDEHHSINPAADVVEVVHGRWDRGQCTNCKAINHAYRKDWNGDYIFTETPFCPNCGAKMDRRDTEC
jgi:hypothetical protein